MSAPLNTRPAPIRDAFKTVGGAVTSLSSLAAALVGWGVLTGVQGDAVVGLIGAVAAVIPVAQHAVTAFRVARVAEASVTPLEDPAVEIRGQLVQLIPDPAQVEAAFKAAA